MNTVKDLSTDFVVLNTAQQATIEHNDATLYARLERDYAGFKGHQLIACHSFSEDWPTWEVHPHGDEVVLLLSGSATLVLRQPDGDHALHLSAAGSYVIVPAGVLHTAKINVPTQMLFITPGQDTQNKVFDA